MIEGQRPLNILHSMRSVRVDGVVKVVLRYVTHFDDARFRHHVCSMRSGDELAGAFRQQGIDPMFIGYRRALDAPAAVRRLARIMRSLDIDLVHTNRTLDLLLAGTAARLCGIPVVSSFHWLARAEDHPEDSAPWVVRKGHENLIALLNRLFADRVIAVSGAVKDGLAQVRSFPLERTEVIYPGIPVNTAAHGNPAAAARLRDELGIGEANPVILNIGRLEAVKGQAHLLPMMRIVRQAYPNAMLLIAGDGSLRPRLERQVRDHRLEGAVRLLGSRDDVDALLAMCDMLVLTSESEAAPLPPVEAMRAGRPVVATAVGGVPEIVEHGVTGLIVDRADPDALAAAVVDLARNPDRARAMGAAGRRAASLRFDIARSVDGLTRIDLSLIRGERKAGVPPTVPSANGMHAADVVDSRKPA
jgi:glycosyltransferase involved in cell wall biosynthesis